MARAKDADSEQTFRTIVDTTLEMLQEAGTETPSLREVAQRAKLSLGTIHYYFDNKEELLEACLDGYYARLVKLGQELATQTSEQGLVGREMVEHVARSLYRFVCQERALVAVRIRTNARRGELHPRRQPDFMGAIIEQAATILGPHIEVDALDARLSVQALSTTMVRFALLSDEELTWVTGLQGAAAREVLEDYIVRAARRLVRPSDG